MNGGALCEELYETEIEGDQVERRQIERGNKMKSKIEREGESVSEQEGAQNDARYHFQQIFASDEYHIFVLI